MESGHSKDQDALTGAQLVPKDDHESDEAMVDPWAADAAAEKSDEKTDEKNDENLKAMASDQPHLESLPGAFSVRGFGGTPRDGESGSDGISRDDLEDPTAPEDAPADSEQPASAEMPLKAYAVGEEEGIGLDSPLPVQATLDQRTRYFVGAVLLLTVLTGTVIWVVSSQLKKESSGEEDSLLVSFRYYSKMDGVFSEGRQFSAIEDGREVITTGNSVIIDCVVGPCKDNPGACRVTVDTYEEGCCFGETCPEETKCGENCQLGACKPSFDGCISPECYICDNPPGEELYRMYETTGNIICINYGSSENENLGTYDWVVYCSEIIQGGHEESNLGVGEYYCQAMRKGEKVENLRSHIIPCQYVQLGECGCGPSDVYPFGLDPPDEPCRTLDDCPFLCSDASGANPQDLCDTFTIEWWEGANFIDTDTFVGNWEHSDTQFDIIIFQDK